ncbi:MAG: serine hydrolase [Pseudomonadota bacterium]
MATFPPAPDAQVTLANWRTGPFNAWAFHHVREIVPSADIPHDPAAVRALGHAPMDTGDLRVAVDGDALGLDSFLAQTHTDGLVVLHRGRVVLERYLNGMGPHDPHILMSVSKSLLGLLAGILSDQGALDLEVPVEDILSEMAATGYRGATIRQMLDMRTGIAFDEDYFATSGPIIEYRKSTNWDPLAPGQAPNDLRGFFQTLTDQARPHGGAFNYTSPTTDMLAWVFERATGTRYADLLSTHLWQKIGAECPGYITVDRLGAPRAAGGVCVTVRDLARLGQMMVEGGGGVVPEAWLDDIAAVGDMAAWEAGSMADHFPGQPVHYRSKWYCLRDQGPLVMATGIHGQNLLVDRSRELVLARVSSHPLPVYTPGKTMVLALFAAIRERICGDGA